jgi:superfamily II DNA/RNA helicase
LLTERSFSELGVTDPLVTALAAQGVTKPFAIQAATLSDTLAGRDVLGRGKTGSGKTLAFSIPLVSGLAGRPRRAARPTGLVLAPTRELATQIAATIEPLADSVGLKVTTVFGGVSQSRQVNALQRGVDIVVACPGRLEDLMKQREISLDDVAITVIDEADHMADLGFLPGVTRILAATPAGGQRLLFSATLDNGVDKLVDRFLASPVMHSVEEAKAATETMAHHVFHVDGAEAKKALVDRLASGTGRRILFMRTKHHARKLARKLTESGIPAVDLHGNLSQPARDRNLAQFAAGDVSVLVATDIAARGVHVDDIELVVHIDPPAEHKAYLHRSGRTARAGARGDVVTIVMPEQRRETQALMRKAGIKVVPQQVHAGSPEVQALVGEIAPYRAPLATIPPKAGKSASPAKAGKSASPAKAEKSGSAAKPGKFASPGAAGISAPPASVKPGRRTRPKRTGRAQQRVRSTIHPV